MNLTGSESSSIQMGQSTKESSEVANKMATEGFSITTVMFTMESGKMTVLTGMGCSKMPQELDMKETGRWTSNMAMEKRSSKTKGRFTRGSSRKARRTEKERSNGRTGLITKETSSMGSMKVQACITSLIKVGSIKVNSRTTKCMGMGKRPGQTEGNIKESTEIPRKMAMEPSFGQMEISIKETGGTTNKMGLENT